MLPLQHVTVKGTDEIIMGIKKETLKKIAHRNRLIREGWAIGTATAHADISAKLLYRLKKKYPLVNFNDL